MMFTLTKLTRLGLWALKQKKVDHPVHGNYDITSRCNFHCEHCYFYRSYPDQSGKNDLSDKEWQEKFAADYEAGVRYAYITGGEPALRLRVVAAADRIFDIVVIFSNGTIKIDPRIKRSIFVSLDGPRAVHARIRGRDYYDRIMQNTKDDRRVLFTCTLSTTNARYIEETYQIAKAQRVCGIMFGFYTAARADFKNDPLYLSGAKREEALRVLSRLHHDDPNFVFVTPKMLAVFRDQRHAPDCNFNAAFGSAVSYYPDGRRKTQCVVGEGANCQSCGCPQPVAVYCGRHFDWQALKLGEKFLKVQLK